MARSLTSGLTVNRTPALLERATSSLETMVEVAIGAVVVDHQHNDEPSAAAVDCGSRSLGSCV